MFSGAEAATTNNRMELMAAIEALRALKQPSRIRLTTDSQYLRQGVTSWVKQWKANGWRTASRQPVKNQDLWVCLDRVVESHQIEWCWVKGHSGHVENELVDAAANEAIDRLPERTVGDDASGRARYGDDGTRSRARPSNHRDRRGRIDRSKADRSPLPSIRQSSAGHRRRRARGPRNHERIPLGQAGLFRDRRRIAAVHRRRGTDHSQFAHST